MYYVGTCPVCEQGTLGLRVCAGQGDLVVLCDECDAVWLYPDCAGEAIYPEQPTLPCPQCGESLLEASSHWADEQEIQRAGWSAVVEGQSEDA
jgi:hypothetical protein